MRGGLAHGAAAALFEHYVGTRTETSSRVRQWTTSAPTAPDPPAPRIGHRESPSTFLRSVRRGLGERDDDERAGRDRECRCRRSRTRRRRTSVHIRSCLGAAPTMKPAPFDYVRPESLDDALAALAEAGGEAKVLAGGQSLVPALNMRLLRPALLGRREPRRGTRRRRERGRRATDRRDRTSSRHAASRTSGARGSPASRRAHGDPEPRHRLRIDRTCGRRGRASPRARHLRWGGDRGLHAWASRDPRRGPVSRAVHDDACAGRAPGRNRVAAASPTTKDSPSTRSRSALTATTRSAWPLPAPEETTSASSSAPSLPCRRCSRVDPERPGESAAVPIEPWGSIHASPDYLRHLVHVLVDRVVGRARERAA